MPLYQLDGWLVKVSWEESIIFLLGIHIGSSSREPFQGVIKQGLAEATQTNTG